MQPVCSFLPYNLNKWIALIWLELIFLHLITLANSIQVVIPDLPAHHYRFWLRNHPLAYENYKIICKLTPNLGSISSKQFHELHTNVSLENNKYLEDLEYGKRVLAEICSNINHVSDSCWGYESGCQHIYVMPDCQTSQENSAKTMYELRATWFNQADFGYIIKLRKELTKYCSYDKHSNSTAKSSLECIAGFKMCLGKSIMFDFQDLESYKSPLPNDREKQDLIKKNLVGGWNCDLQTQRIKSEGSQRGSLQSWFNELEHYSKIQKAPEEICDETIKEQVFILKLDSTSNMYHYFCNFINLYATFHLNNKFSSNIRIIIWDKQIPKSKFELMWKAFSKRPVEHIGQFQNKRVCFNNFTLALLPRAIDGLYYNTNLVPGCSKSGLFDAFNKHVLHRLNINQDHTKFKYDKMDNTKLNITFISRSSSKHRKIVNEKNLIRAMKKEFPQHHIEEFDYAVLKFNEQLEITSNTDLLIGIHGAGLTHTLFLPDWSSLFEIYNCNDTRYHDLARLRGATYFTIGSSLAVTKLKVEDPAEASNLNATKLLDNEKFSNYRIHEPIFLKDLKKAIEKVTADRLRYFGRREKLRFEQEEPQTIRKRMSTTETRHTEL